MTLSECEDLRNRAIPRAWSERSRIFQPPTQVISRRKGSGAPPRVDSPCARKRRLGWRRIQSELQRNHNYEVSRTTVEKVLGALEVQPLSWPRRPRNGGIRYARLIPGEGVQMDTCKIAPGVYQYTAIDDCTRVRVCSLPAQNGRELVVVSGTRDRGNAFPHAGDSNRSPTRVLCLLLPREADGHGIKFRPIPPRSPHLKEKVERSQRTVLDEFYATVDVRSPDLPQRLQEWQDHYNQYRSHGALHGRTPWQVWLEKLAVTPFHDEVDANFDPFAERFRHPNYRMDLQLAQQKPRTRKWK